MNWIEKTLAFVQIFFESLPVSSSTHVLISKIALAKHLGAPIELKESLFFLWHIPSTLIFLIFVTKKLMAQSYKIEASDKNIQIVNKLIECLFFLGISCIPIAIVHIFFSTKFSLGLSKNLIFGLLLSGTGLLLLKILPKPNRRWSELNIKDAAICGLAQLASLVPGVSRMATTTSCFYSLGYNAQDTLILSLLQQAFLTIAMIGKILTLKPQLLLDALGLGFGDLLIILAASACGWFNLKITEVVLTYRKTELFFAYYLVLSLVILTLGQ